jgi:hypothetical protein
MIGVEQLMALTSFGPRPRRDKVAGEKFFNRYPHLPSTHGKRNAAYACSQSWESDSLNVIAYVFSHVSPDLKGTSAHKKQNRASCQVGIHSFRAKYHRHAHRRRRDKVRNPGMIRFDDLGSADQELSMMVF